MENEVSTASLAKEAFTPISKLCTSETDSDRLIGINVILFIFTLSLVGTAQLTVDLNVISLVAFTVILGLFASILSLAYLPVLVAVAGFVKKDLFALKFSVGIMFILTGLAFYATYYLRKDLLSPIILGIIAQLVLVIVLGFIKVPIKKIETENSPAKNRTGLGKLFWGLLERIDTIGGVITFIILVLSFLKIG